MKVCVKGELLPRALTYVVPVLGACLIFVLSGVPSSSSTLAEKLVACPSV